MNNDNIIELAKKLSDIYEEAYNLCYPTVNKIIKYKIKDSNLIEQTLDQALNIYTEKGFYLFIKLLIYYRTVNYENAKEYLNILKENREEEYNEFVKKIGKKK